MAVYGGCDILHGMTILQAMLIGAIQGLTEFLPISSSGHLVLADIALGISLESGDALGFDVLLHASSLLALLLVYRNTWMNLIRNAITGTQNARRTIGLLALGTVPGVIAGLTLQDRIGDMRSLTAVGVGLLITGFVLILGEWIGKQRAVTIDAPMTVTRALWIGIAQAIAILPGVSRSGCTISTGRALGMQRRSALDFSFLLAAPIIAGATAKTLLDAWTGDVFFPSLSVSIAGLLTSFVVSILAISLLQLLVVRRSLSLFAWYVVPLGTTLLVYSLFVTRF
jgi:undecaprenyl-diphosphatase